MTVVTVPEAPMDEYHSIVFRKYEIRGSWQFAVMQPEAEAHAMQAPTYYHFRLGILASYAGHHPAADFRGNNVSHRPVQTTALKAHGLRRGTLPPADLRR